MQTWAEIQSITVHKIIDYRANHLFPFLREQVAATIEDEFATGLLRNNKAVRQEFCTAAVRAMKNKKKDRQEDSDIPRATRRIFEWESFVTDKSQCIAQD